MARHLDSRRVLLSAPLVPGVQTKTRLESSITNFKPHLIYDCFSGVAGVIDSDLSTIGAQRKKVRCVKDVSRPP